MKHDRDAAWASAHALQADDVALQVGDEVRHRSDARRYLVRSFDGLLALCAMHPKDGDGDFTQEFLLEQLVRSKHIAMAMLLHSDASVIDHQIGEQTGQTIIEFLRR